VRGPAKRIASLLPSATEIVCALGCGDRLVGVSHECDFPPGVSGHPVLTEPKVRPDGTSVQIHAEVEGIVRDGLSVYRIKTERLRALAPDLIVTQDQCEVCAVSLGEVERAAREVLDHDVTIVSLRTTRLAGLWDDIQRVAAAAGVPAAGQALVDRLRDGFDAMGRRAERATKRPRVAFIEWVEPLMLGGNWVPELVTLVGGSDDGLVAPGAHSAWTDWHTLAEYAPEVILVAPCGFTIDQALRDLPLLTSRPEWPELPAVAAGRVFVVDGSTYFNRPGPRLLDSTEILAHAMHPTIFDDAPREGWRRL
jgi:iron complex transport system substrate-binding protein